MSRNYASPDSLDHVIDEMTSGVGGDQELKSVLEAMSALRLSTAPEPSGLLADLIKNGLPGPVTQPRTTVHRRSQLLLVGTLILSAMGLGAGGVAFAADAGFRREAVALFQQLVSPTPLEKVPHETTPESGHLTNPESPNQTDIGVGPTSVPQDESDYPAPNTGGPVEVGTSADSGSTDGVDSGDTRQATSDAPAEPQVDGSGGPLPIEPDPSSSLSGTSGDGVGDPDIAPEL